jgi:glycosyltransferase involved in cell wall biosynthesis
MANDKPRVCVVVPILNEVRYIRESMDSLLAQDYQPLEIIVYDAGSTDGTLDILKTYPVEVIVEPGLGQMAAINRGWRRTSAEFVTWWAGDDRYKPGAIRRLVEELQAHPEVGFVHSDADIIDEHGDIIRHNAPGDIQLRDLVIDFSMLSQTALIRRSALERSGMMDESRRLAADWDLFLRLTQYYSSCYIPFTAAEYRSHAGSEDKQNYEKGGQAIIDVLDRFFERPDLTDEQRALRPYGVAGSRLLAGWGYCVVGKRREAWRMLFQALGARPSLLLKTRAGRRLLLRLLMPIGWTPHQLRSLKRAFGRAFARW